MNDVDKNDVCNGRPNVIAEMCSPAFLRDVKQAEIIFGVDEETKNKFIVFGKSLLKDIASGTEARTAETLTVPILQRTEEFECLLAAVGLVKGHYDYTPSGH